MISNLPLLLVVILFIILVTGHHHLSLILCLLSPGVPCSPLQSPDFCFICLAVIPITCGLCPPPPLLLSPYHLLMPHSPPHSPGRPPISSAVCLNSWCHMCLTILRKAQCVGPSGPNLARQSPWCFALDRTTASGPILLALSLLSL